MTKAATFARAIVEKLAECQVIPRHSLDEGVAEIEAIVAEVLETEEEKWAS